MGWSIGYDEKWERDIGYGVPAYCDHPDCNAEIDRGLSYVCGGQPYGGDHGCGLYFCERHLTEVEREDEEWQVCERCAAPLDADGQMSAEPFPPKPEHPRWMRHVLHDKSWARWRAENPKKVREFDAALRALPATPTRPEEGAER